MTSVMGSMTPSLTMRRAPRPGEIGHPGTCPLCADGRANAAPPCLACRDELRARLVEYTAATTMRALN